MTLQIGEAVAQVDDWILWLEGRGFYAGTLKTARATIEAFVADATKQESRLDAAQKNDEERVKKWASTVARVEEERDAALRRLDTVRKIFCKAFGQTDLCDATKETQPVNSVLMLELEEVLWPGPGGGARDGVRREAEDEMKTHSYSTRAEVRAALGDAGYKSGFSSPGRPAHDPDAMVRALQMSGTETSVSEGSMTWRDFRWFMIGVGFGVMLSVAILSAFV